MLYVVNNVLYFILQKIITKKNLDTQNLTVHAYSSGYNNT